MDEKRKKIRGMGGEVKFLIACVIRKGHGGCAGECTEKEKNVIKLRIKEREIHYKIKTSTGLLGTDVDNVLIKDQSSFSRNFRDFSVCFCFPLT